MSLCQCTVTYLHPSLCPPPSLSPSPFSSLPFSLSSPSLSPPSLPLSPPSLPLSPPSPLSLPFSPSLPLSPSLSPLSPSLPLSPPLLFLPLQLPDTSAPMDPIAEERSGEDTTSTEGSEHNPAKHDDSTDNIKLQRVTGVSLRHTKAPPASVLKEGWMVHYTNKSTVVCWKNVPLNVSTIDWLIYLFKNKFYAI